MKRPSFSSLWQEFKAFAFKGNMIDLAVAVVIGAAFSGVINSLVKDVIMPSVTYAVNAATTAASTAGKTIKETAIAVASKTTQPADTQPATQPSDTQPADTQPATRPVAASPPAPPAAPQPPPAPAPPQEKKPVDLQWTLGPVKIGNFIGELINFLLIALAVFLVIVKLLGSVMKRVGGTPAPSDPTTKECQFCLSVIPIKARKCAHCTADLPESSTAASAPGAV